MKQTKRLIALFLALILAAPTALTMSVRAQETPPEERNLAQRTGLKPMEERSLSEKDLPDNYSYEKKVIGSAPYESGANKEWAEYSSYFYYNQLAEKEQQFYDRLMEECLVYFNGGGEIIADEDGDYLLPEVSYGDISENRAKEIYRIFYSSNPQFYFLMNALATTSSTIYPRVYKAFAAESDRKAATSQIRSALSAYEAEAGSKSSEYDKVKAVHDKI